MNKTLYRALGLYVETPTDFFCWSWENVIRDTEDGNTNSALINSPREILKCIENQIYLNNANDKNNIIRKHINAYNKLCKGCHFLKEITNNEHDEKKLTNEIREISEIYDKHLFDNLCDIVVDEINNNLSLSFESKENIEKYIKLLVCEFIHKEFELKSIIHLSKHPRNILTNEFGEVVIFPQSFEKIHRNDYETEDEYKRTLSLYLRQRDISQRIKTIKDYFHNETNTFTVCYRIKGLRGEIDTSIGSIKLSSKPPDYGECQFNSTDENGLIYAMKDVVAQNPDAAILKGLHTIETLVCLLTIKIQPNKPLVVGPDNAIVFNGHRMCVDKNTINSINNVTKQEYFESYEISHYDLQSNGFQLNSIESFANNHVELNHSLYYYRKASKTKEHSDKLIFSWMALENIFKLKYKSEKIPIKCAIIIAPHVYYTQWYLLYNYIRECINGGFVSIPANLIEQSGLDAKSGQQIKKDLFLLNLNRIENSIKDEGLKTEIHKTHLLYTDPQKLEKEKTNIINDLCQILNMRNLIVHNAYFDENIIKAYSNKAFNYCTCVFNGIIHKAINTSNDLSLSEIIESLDNENREKLKCINIEIKKRGDTSMIDVLS